MIIYFADREMNILGQGSTSLPKGLKIIDDKKEEDITSGTKIFEFYLDYNDDNKYNVHSLAKAGNYILRKDKDEFEFYTIIETETESYGQDGSIYIYCEDAGLDLLNEVATPFKAPTSHSIGWYITKYIYDTGFEIGVNEIGTENKLLLGWDTEDTDMARILDIADSFDCEIKFRFEIKGLKIVKKYIDILERIGQKTDFTLRMGKDVNKIVRKESISSLVTSTIVTGGYPENSDKPITLAGITYDDGDIKIEPDGRLSSKVALSKWSRYLSGEGGDNVGHIVGTFKYDTTNKETLFLMAYLDLANRSKPEISYDVDIVKLPSTVKIGDTINIVDENGLIYVSARILKLTTSISNNTITATLGNFIEKDSGISQKTIDIKNRFKESLKEYEEIIGKNTLKSVSPLYNSDNTVDNTVDIMYPVGTCITNFNKDFNPNISYDNTKWNMIKENMWERII